MSPRSGEGAAPLACVVVNPSKRAATPAALATITDALARAGYRPLVVETAIAEPGATQARIAVASGASLVVAAGGDGTVRAVAAGLAGTGVPMGLIPLGTANLAARNLDLPVGRIGELARIAAQGHALPTDLAWVTVQPPDGAGASTGKGGAAPSGPGGTGGRGGTGGEMPTAPAGGWTRPTLGAEHACLVVTGIGFDAGLVASTRPELKARITWGAYAVAALENLAAPRLDMVVSIEEEAVVGPVPAGRRVNAVTPGRRIERLTARTLLIANGGRLPAGITLLPGARMDDGDLDLAAIDVVAGVAGWGSLARQVLPPFAASYSDPTRSLGRVTLRRGRDVVVRLAEPAMVQVDGDLIAPTRGVRVRVAPGAVLIRRQ